MKDKEVIIIVPGAKYAKCLVTPLERIILNLTKLIPAVDHNYAKYWAKRLDKKNRDIMWLHWDGGITLRSKWSAVERLRRIIKEYGPRRRIKIIGISLGGEIALEAAKVFESLNIEKIILICPTIEHTNINFKKTKIINLYSDTDSFAKVTSRLLAPIHGSIKIEGKNISSIMIPNFNHDDFYLDKRIIEGRYKGQYFHNLVDTLLDK